MSSMDSMAAVRASPPSLITSPRASPEPQPSQYASPSHSRSLSPAERSSKRRRIDSAFPEIHVTSSNFSHSADDDLITYSSPRPGSQSSPDLHVFINSGETFEPQSRTFLGHDREFMSHILSLRAGRGGQTTIRRHPHSRGFHDELGDLPVVSKDNESIIGWRGKADTWPVQKGRGVQRSFTFPQ